MISSSNFPATLKKLRKERGLTQQGLADAVGLSKATITAYETGLRIPTLDSLVALEQYFDVSGAYLRGETDESEPPWWNDPEARAVVESSLLPMMKGLYDLFEDAPLTIKADLKSVLGEIYWIMRGEDNELRETRFQLMRECMVHFMFFAETAKHTDYGHGEAALDEMRQNAVEGFEAALNKVQTHYRESWIETHPNADNA